MEIGRQGCRSQFQLHESTLEEERILQDKVSGQEAIMCLRLEEMKKRYESTFAIKNKKIGNLINYHYFELSPLGG